MISFFWGLLVFSCGSRWSLWGPITLMEAIMSLMAASWNWVMGFSHMEHPEDVCRASTIHYMAHFSRYYGSTIQQLLGRASRHPLQRSHVCQTHALETFSSWMEIVSHNYMNPEDMQLFCPVDLFEKSMSLWVSISRSPDALLDTMTDMKQC